MWNKGSRQKDLILLEVCHNLMRVDLFWDIMWLRDLQKFDLRIDLSKNDLWLDLSNSELQLYLSKYDLRLDLS